MTAKEIDTIIRQLKIHKMSIEDVPEEVFSNQKIVRAERKLGLRKSHERGFDIINGAFFVVEELLCVDHDGEMNIKNRKSVFDTLEEYYDFLEGDIYTDACYQYYDFAQDADFINAHKIDIKKLEENKAFINQTLADFSLESPQEEIEEYEEGEKTKQECKKWIEEFDKCKSCEELLKMADDYRKSEMRNRVDVSFFFFYYIFQDVTDADRFNNIMRYVSTGRYPAYKLIYPLCTIYDIDKVVENYNYVGAKAAIYRKKRALRYYVEKLKNEEIEFVKTAFFDDKTHFYCEETVGHESNKPGRVWSRYQRYFETFDEFIEYRNGDLKDCDLSKAIKLSVDFSEFDSNEKTKLPIVNCDEVECTVKKEYRGESFYVEQQWKDKRGCLIKQKKFSTPYFFDFVYYLENDLTNANLLFCDGLKNFVPVEGINFDGALLTSAMCEKFGVKYEPYEINQDVVGSFEYSERNEEITALSSTELKDSLVPIDNIDMHSMTITGGLDGNSRTIHYITDIHLMHRLLHAGCKSQNDVLYVVRKIAENLAQEAGELLLIGGDVSSEFDIFKLFVEELKNSISKAKYGNTEVIFILGNHELWEFPDKSIDEITTIYRELIEKKGMMFIQNDLLYKDESNNFCQIKYEQLWEYDYWKLRDLMQSASLVIFGGLGFSGYNEEFNAQNGIYRSTLDRSGELQETEKFEKLYHTIVPCIRDKNVIIFTHMPLKDWCKTAEPKAKFVYVNGHTHRNAFYDDGDYRIYSDNQVGYHNEKVCLKSFIMDKEYDYCSDYEDGIFEISSSQYRDFYRGKNILMNFHRQINVLYMLKKNGYYCFIHKSKSGSLSILNGGSLKQLDEDDVEYYYAHMDEVISYIKRPLDMYMNVEQSISETIQKLGGSGTIHGCIIDIDAENHIYVNPVDMKVTGYYASDMIHKLVYPDVEGLLKAECPGIYSNYLKLLKRDNDNPLVPRKKAADVAVLPQEYLSTDIYKASREIKKMQKLSSNILSSWHEKDSHE